MLCKYCGQKINSEKSTVCPSCGSNIDVYDYGQSFYEDRELDAWKEGVRPLNAQANVAEISPKRSVPHAAAPVPSLIPNTVMKKDAPSVHSTAGFFSRHKLPIIISSIAVVIILVLSVILVFFFTKNKSDDVPVAPVHNQINYKSVIDFIDKDLGTIPVNNVDYALKVESEPAPFVNDSGSYQFNIKITYKDGESSSEKIIPIAICTTKICYGDMLEDAEALFASGDYNIKDLFREGENGVIEISENPDVNKIFKEVLLKIIANTVDVENIVVAQDGKVCINDILKEKKFVIEGKHYANRKEDEQKVIYRFLNNNYTVNSNKFKVTIEFCENRNTQSISYSVYDSNDTRVLGDTQTLPQFEAEKMEDASGYLIYMSKDNFSNWKNKKNKSLEDIIDEIFNEIEGLAQ